VAEHPEVAEAAVIGAPDPLKGEVPVAFVVARPGASPTEESLRAFCQARMPAYQVPVRFTLVAALPRNESGKLLRAALLESAAADAGGRGRA
jgi:acyl-coenzyme A synthetase/AMP-(fatty) acid ligase